MYLLRRVQLALTTGLIFVPYIGLIAGSFARGPSGRSLKFASLGFGAGFTIPGIMAPVILFLSQGWIGKQNSARILFFATAFGLVFFLAGMVGGLFLNQGSRKAFSVGAGFGAGGICGGIVMSIFFIFRNSFHGMSGIPTLVAGWLLPYFLGGSFLGMMLRKQTS
jgi:hypothetical protein